MKRLFAILLVLLAMLMLTGCCLKHVMQPASCTQPATCSKCGKTEGAPLGHTEVIEPAKEPTCTETGLTEGSHCAVCGEVLKAQEEIPALGHTEVIEPAKEPTCTETGLTEGIRCSVCGEVLKAQEEIPALGHTEVTDPVKEPTCTESGLTKGSHCSSCGAVLESQDKIPPLGHTVVTDPAKEPSCTQTGLTEGGHCSVCGKVLREQEVIPMLPHTEAADPGKEPTCTETGLTEGSHCAVCGEVLKAQEEIPALGHDWAEASFSKPKTCLVCGKTEGEALGAELFLNALEAGEKQAGDRAAARMEEYAEREPVFKTFMIRGRTSGFDELDDILAQSTLKLTVDTREKDTLALAGDVTIPGADPIKAVLTADREGLSFALPGLARESWYMSREALESLLGTTIPFDPAGRNSAAALRGASREMLMRYVQIILGVFTPENTAETQETYELELLGGKEECTVLRGRPDAGQWQRMLEKLYTTAMNDPELESELRKYADVSGAYQQMEYPAARYRDTADDMVHSFRSALMDALREAEYTAQMLAGYSFELAMRDGRVHALKLLDGGGMLAGYESDGDLDDERADVLMIRAGVPGGITLKNNMRKSGDTTNGFMSLDAAGLTLSYQFGKTADGQPVFDIRMNAMGQIIASSLRREAENAHLTAEYSSMLGGAALDVLSADGGEEVVIPDGKITEITTQEQLQKAINDIGYCIEGALYPEPAAPAAGR